MSPRSCSTPRDDPRSTPRSAGCVSAGGGPSTRSRCEPTTCTLSSPPPPTPPKPSRASSSRGRPEPSETAGTSATARTSGPNARAPGGSTTPRLSRRPSITSPTTSDNPAAASPTSPSRERGEWSHVPCECGPARSAHQSPGSRRGLVLDGHQRRSGHGERARRANPTSPSRERGDPGCSVRNPRSHAGDLLLTPGSEEVSTGSPTSRPSLISATKPPDPRSSSPPASRCSTRACDGHGRGTRPRRDEDRPKPPPRTSHLTPIPA